MMQNHALEVFINAAHAGELRVSQEGLLSFQYDRAYAGPDLSVSLPYTGGVYTGRAVDAWFDNLLPDDESVRRGMANREGINPGVFALLSRYGLDLPGAVQVAGDNSRNLQLNAQPPAYRLLTDEQIGSRLREMLHAEEERRAHSWALGRERWSLGGMQAKLALREHNGKWSECIGSAASNVIVKPGVWGLESQALDECVTMKLARLCGLPAADARICDFDGLPAIVVGRYDRVTDRETGFVRRVHQEDLCQATGTISSKKYTMDGGPSSATIMKLLQGAQGKSRERFIDALLFNYLTASIDAHAKNYSLLHICRGEYTLAPLYDLASAAPYMSAHTVYRCAMSIGGENRVGWLRKSSLVRFSRNHNLDSQAIINRTDELAQHIIDNLETAVDRFSDCTGIDELAEKLVPRVRLICQHAQRNIRADGKQCQPLNPSRLVAP